MTYHTTPGSLAAELRAIADLLDKTPHAEISPVWVGMSLQAVGHGAPLVDRLATVAVLADLLELSPRESERQRVTLRDLGSRTTITAYTTLDEK